MEHFTPIDAFKLIETPARDRGGDRRQPARGEGAAALPRRPGAGAGTGRVPLPAGGARRQPALRRPSSRCWRACACRTASCCRRAPSCRRSRPGRSAAPSTGWRWPGAEGAGGEPRAAALGQHVAAARWATRTGWRSSPPRHRGGSGVCGRLIIEITEDAAMRRRRPDHRLHGPCARHRLRLRARRLRRRRHRLPLLPRLPLRHGQDRRRLRAGRARRARRAGAGGVPDGGGAPLRDGDGRRAGRDRGRRRLAARGRGRLPAGLPLRPPARRGRSCRGATRGRPRAWPADAGLSRRP